MSAVTNSNHSNSFFQDVYQGAKSGGKKGALVGTTIVGGLLVAGTLQGVMERVIRALGHEPKWPLFEGDCLLPQFRDFSACTNPQVSFTVFAVYVIGATTLGGIVLGAGDAAKRSFSARVHSE